MKHEKISIKWKIFFYLFSFTGILLVILWLFQICYLDTFYKMIKTKEAEEVQTEIISLIQDESEDSDLSDAIDKIAAKNNLSVLVADTQGNEIYSADYITNSRMSTIPTEIFNTYYERALENGGSTKIEFQGNDNKTFDEFMTGTPPEQPEDGTGGTDGTTDSGTDNTTDNTTDGTTAQTENSGDDASANEKYGGFIMNRGQEMTESVIYVNVIDTAEQTYVLMLNSQLTPVDATVNTLKVQMICISIVMVLLSLVIAVLISRKISKSIIKINGSAKELAKGNFQIHFDGKDYREIAELSNTLNFAANELEKTEGFRRELIANVSHDLRTPLTMIIAYSEVMRDLPGENTPENIQVVIDESKRLTNLVNDMLDLSKLQAGVLEKNAVVYNLTESIHSVLERYNKLKEQEGYIINFEYGEEVIVEADEFKIFQVIYNLVNNAINYTGEDKTVIVRQKIVREGTKARIEVCDSGQGIEPDAIPYVWDRYYKVDKTHKRAVAGTGLGLSIVKNILQLHDASFGVDSVVGHGSVFWFEMDIYHEENTVSRQE